MDLRQSQEYAEYLKSIGWVVEKTDGCHIYIRKIPLTPFSIIKIQRPRKIPFRKTDRLAKKYRALVIYLEPLTINHKSSTHSEGISRSELNHKYRPSKSPFLPAKTIHLDLTQPKKKILAQMKKDARYEIRKAKRKEIQLIKVQDLAKFHQAWKKSVDWQRYVPSLKSLQHLKKAFGEKAVFLGIGKPLIAGTVILMANKTAYYYYAFSSKEGRRKSAQYLLVWEAIKLAKKQGCKIFDFEGIYDERFPIKSWKGFSHFKRSFGGKEIEYSGCFVKYRFPF